MTTDQYKRLLQLKRFWTDLIARTLTAKRRLRRGDSFCIMGAACEVYRRHNKAARWTNDKFVVKGLLGDWRYAEPEIVRQWFGLGYKSAADLIIANDLHGPEAVLSTLEIIIEKLKTQ